MFTGACISSLVWSLLLASRVLYILYYSETARRTKQSNEQNNELQMFVTSV